MYFYIKKIFLPNKKTYFLKIIAPYESDYLFRLNEKNVHLNQYVIRIHQRNTSLFSKYFSLSV